MKKLIPSLLSLLTLSLVTACGGGASSAAGVYHLDTAPFRERMAAEMKGVPEAEVKKQLDAMVGNMSGSIDLKADGSASIKLHMMMMNEEATGTWKLDGATLSITAKGKDGKEETKTAKFADGAITIEEQEGKEKMQMVFRRK